MRTLKRQPWLNSAVSDSIFILSPPFLSLLIVFLFPEQFKVSAAMPVVYWMILVVFIDVAHVYATLYRTYFNPDGMKTTRGLLLVVPLCCYVVGVLLYQMDGLWFWRVLAYLAVFHFIRQQYGFMRLYSRGDQVGRQDRLIDAVTIYTATLFPILYWHFGALRNFSWFVAGDFFYFPSVWLIKLAYIYYGTVLVVYLIKEIVQACRFRQWNLPKNLIIVGTALSWYFGIVYFNGDMAFTTLNVVSHGIPYMALIWFFEKDKQRDSPPQNPLMRISFSRYGIILFLIIMVLFAYFEEGMWDGLVWREHETLFGLFKGLPEVNSKELLSLLVPLLALPQSTHYVLDGFIWKRGQ